jgi:hypothetical protein
VLFLSGGAIIWLTKFGLVCLSIFESEYSSLKELVKNALAARHLLEELPLSWITQNATNSTTLLNHSLASQQVSNNPKYHARTKHMEIAEHWIQQVIRQGHVRVQHIDCKFNLADMMVKALTKSEFRYWLPSLMGYSLVYTEKITLASTQNRAVPTHHRISPDAPRWRFRLGPFQELEIKPTAGEVLAKRKRVNFESVKFSD